MMCLRFCSASPLFRARSAAEAPGASRSPRQAATAMRKELSSIAGPLLSVSRFDPGWMAGRHREYARKSSAVQSLHVRLAALLDGSMTLATAPHGIPLAPCGIIGPCVHQGRTRDLG